MKDIFFLLGSDLHNFANDNTVTAVAETFQVLINSLEVKTSNARVNQTTFGTEVFGTKELKSGTTDQTHLNRLWKFLKI